VNTQKKIMSHDSDRLNGPEKNIIFRSMLKNILQIYNLVPYNPLKIQKKISN